MFNKQPVFNSSNNNNGWKTLTLRTIFINKLHVNATQCKKNNIVWIYKLLK